jgi:hypothetical protein
MTREQSSCTDWAPAIAELERGLLQRDVAARVL